jgi:hypothetical protein
MEQQMQAAIDGMRKHGFEVVELANAAQAKDYLLAHIAPGSSVGVSGSVSVRETEVLPALEAKGHTVHQHWGIPKSEVTAVQELARTADVYLTSANAITKTGSLVFIDGTCNRVSAILFGPKQVYFVVSRSKYVDGGINTAIARIKQTACPQNARRIGLSTPCGTTGLCKPEECGEDCMCTATVVLDRPPRGRQMTVLLVEEALGY